MEIYPRDHHNHYEIEELMHHGLLAVRPHSEQGEEVFHHLQHAILADLYEHGQLVGFLLDPHVQLPHMTVEHTQHLHELHGVRLGVANFHVSVHHNEGHHYSEGHHEGGLLHEVGDLFSGGHHEERHHGGHHDEGHHGGHHEDRHHW